MADRAEEIAAKGSKLLTTALGEAGMDRTTGLTLPQRVGLSMYRGGDKDDAAARAVAGGLAARARRGDVNRMPDGTTMRGVHSYDPSMGGPHSWYQRQLHKDQTRLAVYRDMDQMDNECGEAGRAIDIVASNLVTPDEDSGGANCLMWGSDDRQVKRVLDELMKRTRLPMNALAQIRHTLKYGDTFLEKVMDDQGLIWVLKNLSPYTMERVENDRGRLLRYVQVDTSGAEMERWDGWEVLHMRHNPPLGHRYGKAFLWRARKVYRQLNLMEDGAVVSMLTRATQRHLHKVPLPDLGKTSQAEFNAYVEQRKRRHDYDTTSGTYTAEHNPLNESDIFVAVTPDHKHGGVEVLEGQQNFSGVRDMLQYFQTKLLINTGVPPSYMGIERDVSNRATVAQEEIEFARQLRSLQAMFARMYKDEVCDLQLFLALHRKIDPAEYWVSLPALSKADEKIRAQIRLLESQAMKNLAEMGIRLDVILTHFFNWDDEAAREVAESAGVQSTEEGDRPDAGTLARIRERLAADDELADVFSLLNEAAKVQREISRPVRV